MLCSMRKTAYVLYGADEKEITQLTSAERYSAETAENGGLGKPKDKRTGAAMIGEKNARICMPYEAILIYRVGADKQQLNGI